MSTKPAFSARKPYPGCNMVHPRLTAADKTFGMNKYLWIRWEDKRKISLMNRSMQKQIRLKGETYRVTPKLDFSKKRKR